MKSLISFIALIGLATCVTFGSYDSSLDPGRITWPQEKWFNNPIEISQATAESTVVLTFHFRTSTAIPVSSAIAQVIYPGSWSTPTTPGTLTPASTSTSVGITVGDLTYTTGTATLTLPSISGSSAVLGPFGLVTRSSATGQIIDANYVFGCIAYTKSESSVTSSGGLSVTSTGIKAIKGSDTLYFTINLSQSLWKHDIIEIVPATDWIPSSSPTCTSVNEAGTTVLSGYSGSSMHCGIADSSSPYPITNADTAGNSVYIYGLDQDAYFNGTAMKLKFSVTSFTLPSYVQSSSLNTWKLKIWRWGTTSLIGEYTAVSGPVDMTAGAISVSSWTPVSKISRTDVVSGMTIFTVASITTSNALNGGGSIVITYSGATVNTNYWWTDIDSSHTGASSTTLCYVTPYISGASCSATDSAKVTLTFTSTQAATTFYVYTLTKFTGNAAILTITSTDSKSKSVDALSASAASWTLSTTNSQMADCFFHGYDTNLYPQIASLTPGKIMGGKYKEYLYFRLKPKATTSWGATVATTLYLNLPIATDVLSFNSILISAGTPPDVYQAIDPLTTVAGTDVTSTSLKLTGTPTISSTRITISIPASTSTLTNTNYLIVGYYGSGTSTGALTSLPYVASNVATFYEMWAQVTSPSEIGSNVFSVLPQTTAYIYSAPLCTTLGSGIPIVNLFTALNMEFNFASSNYNFAIDIDIGGTSASYSDSTGFMGTSIMKGTLASGTFYTSATTTPIITISTYTDKSSVKHSIVTLKNIGDITSGSTVTTYLPNVNTANTYTVTTTFYYTTSADSSTKMVLYQDDTTKGTWTVSGTAAWGTTGTGTTTPTPTISAAAPSSGSSWIIGNSGTITAILATAGTSKSIADTNIIGVGLSTGWTTSSSTIGVSSNSDATAYTGSATFTSAATSYAASSSNDTSTGGFIFGKVTSSWAAVTDGASASTAKAFSLQLTNLTPLNRLSADPHISSSFTFWVATATPNAACTYSSAVTGASIGAGAITISSFTPSTVKAAGPDSSDTSITVTFSLAHAVPAGGTIEITFYTEWGWSASSSYLSCSCSSLTASTAGAKLCDPSSSGNKITLQNFNAISASSSLTVQLDHILPPSSAGSLKMVKSIYSYASGSSGYIDKYSNGGSDNVYTVTSPTVAGTTSGMGVTAYPNVAGQIADLYFTFTLPYSLPAGGTLAIAAPSGSSWSWTSSTDIKDSCWVDAGSGIYYTSCQVSSSGSVTLIFSSALASGASIKLYLDAAITVPSTMSTGFVATASWASFTLFADSSAGVKFTPEASISAQITLNAPTITDIQNQGEAATYSFSFTSAATVASGDYFVIRFPRNFDPYLGDATVTYQSTPNAWYIPCSSTALGAITCTVDHWQLYVTGTTKSLAASAAIDLSVSKIRNPYTSSSGSSKFSAFHYDKTSALKASVSQSQAVTTSSPGSLSTLKRVASSSAEQAASSSYDFDFYVTSDLTIASTNVFSIVFPSQFNLQLTLGSTATCSTSYFDETNTSGVDPTATKTWNSATSCSVSGQTIALTVPTSTSSMTFKANAHRIRISFSTLSNPQSALTNRDAATGWDVKDTTEFGEFASWSNKFDVIISDTSSKSVVGRSYGVLHSGYLGYTLSTSQTGSNGNSDSPTSSTSRIVLLPGEQSEDITISVSEDWPLMSKNITLTPSSNANYPDSGNLKYSSAFYKFVVFQMESELTFRVSASSATATGVYYIDWKIQEYAQEGSSNRYSAPVSMLVEVNSAYSTLPTITVAKISALYPGYKSLPVAVTLSNAPASDMTINLSLDSSLASVTPTALKFLPDVNTLYFQITIGGGYTSTSTAPTLSFSLAGTDKAIYSAPASQKLSITTTTSTLSAATVSLAKQSVTGSSITITATTTASAVLYWGIGCQGHEIPTFSQLVGTVADLVNPTSSQVSLHDQLKAEYAATETDPSTAKGDTDIYSFFKRKHREHCDDYWASSQVVGSGATTVTFDWLMGGTTYTITAFADNKLINDTSSYKATTVNISTSDLPQIQSTSVSFATTVQTSSGDSIRQKLAKNMGVNPLWLTDQVVKNSRMLADGTGTTTTTTTFTYNVIYDRSKPSYTPASIIGNIDSTTATTDLTAIVGVSPTYGATTAVSTGTAPTWTAAPAFSSKTDTSAVFTATSSQVGTVYASCTTVSGYTTYAWQVVDGLDGSSSSVPHTSAAVATAGTSVTLTVAGLSAGTSYNCYFTACNSYPLWSTCIDVSSSTSSLAVVAVTTSGSSSTDSSAVIMGTGVLAALFLIFN